MKNKKQCLRCKELESVIYDIHWMARRYATNRMTYAPSMFNDAINKAVKLGLILKEDTIEKPPTIYAKESL